MLERIIFAGFGGQGVLTMGKVVAGVGMELFDHVTYFPSYGTEVRGGTANCQVVLSDTEIASPIVDRADSMIVMNQPSLERFLPRLAVDGGVYVNTSLAESPNDERAVCVPATDMASDLGDVRVANTVLLGAYLSTREWADIDRFRAFLEKQLGDKGRKVLEINLAALRQGLEFRDAARTAEKR